MFDICAMLSLSMMLTIMTTMLISIRFSYGESGKHSDAKLRETEILTVLQLHLH